MNTIIQKNGDCISVCKEINRMVEPDIIMLTPAERQEIEKLEWISVDEQLPDSADDAMVIMQHEDGTPIIQIGFFYDGTWVLYNYYDKAPDGWIVVYWRPMLAIPDLEQ